MVLFKSWFIVTIFALAFILSTATPVNGTIISDERCTEIGCTPSLSPYPNDCLNSNQGQCGIVGGTTYKCCDPLVCTPEKVCCASDQHYDSVLGCTSCGTTEATCTIPADCCSSAPVCSNGHCCPEGESYVKDDFGEYHCRATTIMETICSDGISNDDDTLIDCADSDCNLKTCAPGKVCKSNACVVDGSFEICNDNIDNDADGKVDCADTTECPASTACYLNGVCGGGVCLHGGENCLNNADDNSNSLVDCADTSNCVAGVPCKSTDSSFTCSNGACVSTCGLGTFYKDEDSDGYGSSVSGTVQSCTLPSGYATNNDDCDDNNWYARPNGNELCWGGADENCNGLSDCADPLCATNPACTTANTSCTSNEDCFQEPPCFTSTCTGGICVKSAPTCVADGVCCYPSCTLTQDSKDCTNLCATVKQGVFGAQDINFYPGPGGLGRIRVYGNASTTTTTLGGVYRTDFSRNDSDILGIGISNGWDNWPCGYLKFSRIFMTMDTQCLNSTMPIANATLQFSDITHHVAYRDNISLYVDKSAYDTNDQRWVLDPATYTNNATRGLNANLIGNIKTCPGCVVEPRTFNVSLTDLKYGDYTRFVMMVKASNTFGNGRSIDGNELQLARQHFDPDCLDYTGATNLDCGSASDGYFTCNYYSKRLPGDVIPNDRMPKCNNPVDKTVLDKGPLDLCINGVQATCGVGVNNVTSSTGYYTCAKTEELYMPITSSGPMLNVVFCKPGYYNECDYTDGCGASRTVNSKYNSCDLKYNGACGTETNCTDGIDNDCDGLFDGRDPDCAGAGIENCTNNVDDNFNGMIDGQDPSCQEGQGVAGSSFRGCLDGIDNDNDGMIDRDDPGCCDFCNATGTAFDNSGAGFTSGIGRACVGTNFSWSPSISSGEYCCGNNNATEHYVTRGVGAPGCCNDSTQCVDINGTCQIGYEELLGRCTNGVDDDCDGQVDIGDASCQGTLQGFVFDEDGYPLPQAEVKSSPPNLGKEYEVSAKTDMNGHYVLAGALVGTYDFIARKEGYDDNISRLTILTNSTMSYNFTLRNGSCHADCTDYYNNCNPACNGIAFDSNLTCNIHPLCYNRPKDFRISYTESGVVHEIRCCEGMYSENSTESYRTYREVPISITGTMKNLYDYVTRVKFGKRYVKMHILTWKNETTI